MEDMELVGLREPEDLEERTLRAPQPRVGEEEDIYPDLGALVQAKKTVQEQRDDPTLSHVYEQQTSVNREVMEPPWLEQYPHFVLKKEHLYHVE